MNNHTHFIGIGGIGMSGIAQLLLYSGKKVSGSDIKESKITQDLRKLGAEIFIGHACCNIQDADLVVYSSAIKENNPEIIEAKRMNIPLIKRAEALAQLMQDKTVITVTGSHGKTTTASLAAYLFLEARMNPTVAIGGILRNIDNNAYLGRGEFFIAEADESDGSFLYYQPKFSIITNIDYEHLDYYKNFASQITAFQKFLDRTKDGGCAFCSADDLNLRQILNGYKKRYVLFGFKEDADIYPKNIRIKNLGSQFDCFYKNKFIERFDLALGGMHNISNALAAIALGLELKISPSVIKKVLASYKGAKRRLEIKFEDQRYILIDDYAHHPTEIKVTLLAVRRLESKRIIAVFQPHRYTRTKLLLDEFGRCFDLADVVFVTDIYPAGEPELEGINARLICDKIKENSPDKEVDFLPKEKINPAILKILKPGDLVITLGAGDIVKNCDELVEELKRQG